MPCDADTSQKESAATSRAEREDGNWVMESSGCAMTNLTHYSKKMGDDAFKTKCVGEA